MEEVKGYVEHIVYRNSDNGYTVFNLHNGDGELTCVGSFPFISEGELLQLTGEYVTHALYGVQLQVQTSEVCEPEDLMSIERYLGSGAVKGWGPPWRRGSSAALRRTPSASSRRSRNAWPK